MDFLIELHIFQGKKRRNKKNVVRHKQLIRPPHMPPHLKKGVVISLMSSWKGNFHHLNLLHVPLEACGVS